jgi:hypothetical protein
VDVRQIVDEQRVLAGDDLVDVSAVRVGEVDREAGTDGANEERSLLGARAADERQEQEAG